MIKKLLFVFVLFLFIVSLCATIHIRFSIEYKKNEIVKINKANDSLISEKEKIVTDSDNYKNELENIKNESVDRIDEEEIWNHIKGKLEKAISQ